MYINVLHSCGETCQELQLYTTRCTTADVTVRCFQSFARAHHAAYLGMCTQTAMLVFGQFWERRQRVTWVCRDEVLLTGALSARMHHVRCQTLACLRYSCQQGCARHIRVDMSGASCWTGAALLYSRGRFISKDHMFCSVLYSSVMTC